MFTSLLYHRLENGLKQKTQKLEKNCHTPYYCCCPLLHLRDGEEQKSKLSEPLKESVELPLCANDREVSLKDKDRLSRK